MSRRLVPFVLFASLLLALAASAQGSFVYVDARAGDDLLGTGSATAPLRTLTKAAAGRWQLPVTFRLRRGTYDESLGEQYPIALPANASVEADPARTSPGSFVVRLRSQLGLAAMFRADQGSATWSFRELSFGGGQFRAIQMLGSGAREVVNLVVDSCEFATSRGIAIVLSDGCRGILAVRQCLVNGVDTPIKLSVSGGATLNVALDAVRIHGGLAAGLLLECESGGRIDVAAVNSVFWRQTRAAALITGNGGTVQCLYEHCTFAEVGRNVIGGAPAALVEAGNGQFGILCSNSLFAGNRFDVASYSARVHTFRTCLVEQAQLQGLGGNLLGTAQFVVPPSSLGPGRPDWHLAPGSPGVDAATPGSVTSDLHGWPRNVPFAGSPPDIGASEVHDRAVWLQNEAKAGGAATLSLRAFGSANAPVVLFVGTGTPGLPFVPGVHLAGVILPFSAGVCDASGLWEESVTVPQGLLPLGAVHWFQPLFLAGAPLGRNAARYVVRGN